MCPHKVLFKHVHGNFIQNSRDLATVRNSLIEWINKYDIFIQQNMTQQPKNKLLIHKAEWMKSQTPWEVKKDLYTKEYKCITLLILCSRLVILPPFWHQGLVSQKIIFPWPGCGGMVSDASHRERATSILPRAFTLGFLLLWESRVTTDVAGGGAQAVIRVTGVTVNTEEALPPHLLFTACHAAGFLTGHRLTLGLETPVLDNRQN